MGGDYDQQIEDLKNAAAEQNKAIGELAKAVNSYADSFLLLTAQIGKQVKDLTDFHKEIAKRSNQFYKEYED